MEEKKKITPLRKAVEWLKEHGKLNQDNDLKDIFNIEKSTISTYLNGIPGKGFVRKFENHFGISLKEFENSSVLSEPVDQLKSVSSNHDKLVRAHELQAEAILSQTKQGESLVETNKMLVTLLVNSGAQLKSPPVPVFPSFEMLEKAAQAGLGKTIRWKTVEEGQELLGKLLIGDYKAKSL